MNRILIHDGGADTLKLRRKAKKVENPQSTEVILCVQAMKKAALAWEQVNPGSVCAGLAAPQIGVNLRIIIMRSMEIPRAPQDPFALTAEQAQNLYGDYDNDPAAMHRMLDAIQLREQWTRTAGTTYDPFLVMYNPVYGESEGMQDSEEGCLSVPYAHGVTLRPEKSTFHYYDHCMRRQPKVGEYTTTDPLAAAVICHEMDHLNGILFIDSAVKTWRPGSKEAYEKQQAEEKARIEGVCEDDTEYDRYESEDAA